MNRSRSSESAVIFSGIGNYWLSHPQRFDIDPDLTLDKGVFHPQPEVGSFGMLLDSSPDRWGQTLMKRREAADARDEGRQPRTLYAWDFLLGVQDLTRQGALRFRPTSAGPFLDDHPLAAPPVTSLREIESIAGELSTGRTDDLDALRRWLSILVAPGASLGGARPKANFLERDGSLWIAKFPSRNDTTDVAAWEMLAHTLARDAGIDVPPANLVHLAGQYRTFCVKRFDRLSSGDRTSRIFYASAMTLLGNTSSDDSSYTRHDQIELST